MNSPHPGYSPAVPGSSRDSWGATAFDHQGGAAPRSHHGLDLAVGIALLAVHAMIVMGTLMMVGFAAMGLDPCSYRACGDRRWADIGLSIVTIAAAALPVADVILVIVQSARRRQAWPVPLVFCVVHLIVGAVCFALMLASGPQ